MKKSIYYYHEDHTNNTNPCYDLTNSTPKSDDDVRVSPQEYKKARRQAAAGCKSMHTYSSSNIFTLVMPSTFLR